MGTRSIQLNHKDVMLFLLLLLLPLLWFGLVRLQMLQAAAVVVGCQSAEDDVEVEMLVLFGRCQALV